MANNPLVLNDAVTLEHEIEVKAVAPGNRLQLSWRAVVAGKVDHYMDEGEKK